MAPTDDVLQNGGKIIALEGDCDMISTQLHLLPPSSNILTFPPLQQTICKPSSPSNFDPQAFLTEINAAYTQRIQAAQSFLKDSSESVPKLVFMNGGSIRAQAMCLEAICENMTAGQIGAAETLFNDLVKDGIPGSLRPHNVGSETKQSKGLLNIYSMKQSGLQGTRQASESETTATQTVTPELGSTYDNTSAKSIRRLSTPTQDEPRFSSKAVDLRSEQEIHLRDDESFLKTNLSARLDPTVKRWTFETFPDDANCLSSSLGILNHSQEDLGQKQTLENPGAPSRSASSILSQGSDEKSLYFASGSKKSAVAIKRAKSIDSSSESKPSYRSTISPRSTQPLKLDGKIPQESKDGVSESLSCENNTQSAFLKAYQTTIIRNPKIARDEFDFGPDEEQEKAKSNEEEFQPFVPVYNPTEDFIIHFTGGVTDVIFDTALRSFHDSKFSARNQIISTPMTPMTPFGAPVTLRSNYEEKYDTTTDADNLSYLKQRSLDLEAALANSIKSYHDNSLLSKGHPNLGNSTIYHKPKFLIFTPQNPSTPIGVHNEFRQLLSSYFPAGESGYNQYYHSVSKEADRLWKPIFGNSDISECGIEKTTVDLIIALGCDENTKYDLTTQISGMIEHLGRKKSGESKSSKLDIRYLISLILQNPYIKPSGQNAFDPFSDPFLTATLIIPQLESYFANNTSANFLVLQFLPSYLPIIFFLRDLIGSSLFKVAAITSSLTSEPSLTSCPPSPLTPNPLSNDAVASRIRTRGHSAKGSIASSPGILRMTVPKSPSIPSSSHTIVPVRTISQSDYLLLNSATNIGISNFISLIQKSLLEKSEYYMTEPEPEPKTIIQVVEKYLNSPTPALSFTTTQSRPSSQHRPTTQEGLSAPDGCVSPKNKRLSKVSQLTRNSSIARSFSEFRPRHHYTNSIASSRRTFVSKLTDDGDNWDDFEICDDDSDFDDFDRMIMGRRMAAMMISGCLVGAPFGEEAVKARGIASKKKALKWLGLA